MISFEFDMSQLRNNLGTERRGLEIMNKSECACWCCRCASLSTALVMQRGMRVDTRTGALVPSLCRFGSGKRSRCVCAFLVQL